MVHCSLGLLRQQISQREIVHDILDVLDPVLESITAAAQAVVLEVEDLESRKQVLDKLVDEDGTLVVTECDGVASKARLEAVSMWSMAQAQPYIPALRPGR
jgi:hypothetical protein